MKNPEQLREEARVLRLWATLAASGINIGEAALIVAETSDVFRTPLIKISEDIATKEQSLAEAIICQHTAFSTFTISLLSGQGKGWRESDMTTKALVAAASLADRVARLRAVDAPENGINEVIFYELIGDLIMLNCPILTTLPLACKEYLPQDAAVFITQNVREGEMIVDGFATLPTKFSPTDCIMMGIGEQTGSVPTVCWSLARTKERILQLALRDIPTSTQLQKLAEFECLALAVDAGLPPLRALRVVAGGKEAKLHRLNVVADMIEQGKTFTEAMSAIPGNFFPWIIALVQQGERDDNLEQKLKQIADFLRWELLGLEPSAAEVLVTS